MNSNPNIELKIYFPSEATSTNYLLEELESGYYIVKWNDPFNEELIYGTIIDLEKDQEGRLIFKRVVKKSNYSCQNFLFPKDFDYTSIKPLQDAIIAEGGYWEIIFHGMLFVNLPSGSNLNVEKELNLIRFGEDIA